MFYEVKIFNAKGEVRRIISSSKLSKRYWDNFLNYENTSRNKKLIKIKRFKTKISK